MPRTSDEAEIAQIGNPELIGGLARSVIVVE